MALGRISRSWERRRGKRPRNASGDSAALWLRFAEAIEAGNEAAFLELCRRHQKEIAGDPESWSTVPENVRADPVATQRYANTMMAIAQVLARRFNRPELLARLTGAEVPGELLRWDEALMGADRLMATDPKQAASVLKEALELGRGFSGTDVDRLCAMTHGRLGTLAFRRGDIQAARSHTNTALEASLAAHDVDGVLTYLRNLYELERQHGHPGQAAAWAQRAVSSAEAGGRPDETPAWLVRLAEAELDGTVADDAVQHARSAVTLALERLSGDPDGASVMLNNAGEVLRKLGRREEAAGLYEQAIAQRRSAGLLDATLARLLGNLAFAFLEGPNPAPAQPLLEESLSLGRALLAPDDSFIAETLNNLAVLYHKLGDTDAARRLYDESLSIRAAAEGPEASGTAALANLAELELEAGQNARAKAALDRLDQAAAREEAQDDELWRISRLARLHVELGNFGLAEQLLQRLRTELPGGQNSPEYVRTLFLEARIKQGLGNLDAAADLMAEGVEGIRSGSDFREDELASALNNFGLLAFDAGRLDDAQGALEESLALRSRYMAGEALELLGTLNNLALVHHHRHRVDEAERLYRRVLEGRRRQLVVGHPDTAQSLFNLGMLLLETDRIREALGFLREQFEAENELIGDMFAVSGEDERLSYVAKLRSNLDVLLLEIVTYAPDDPEAIQLAFDVALQRKGIVADAMAADRRAIALGQAARHAASMRSLTELRRRISRLVLDGPGAGSVASYADELTRLVEERRRQEAALARAVTTFYPASRLATVDRRAVAEALPPGAALVEYLHATMSATGGVSADAYFGFVLTAGSPDEVRMFPVGLADVTDAAVNQFRRAVVSGFVDEDLEDPEMIERKTGRELRRVLIDRVREATGDRMHLVLSPDGELGKLPFECLPLDDSGVVGDVLRIDYVTSGRDLVRTSAARATSTAPLVVGDPDFDLKAEVKPPSREAAAPRVRLRGSGIRFDRLQETAAEVEMVSQRLNARVLTGGDALEGSVTACRSPRILHIATHGFFLQDELLRRSGAPAAGPNPIGLPIENPLLRSGLALAGANAWLDGAALPDEADDGLLTAEDVTGMDLAGTELVVLSACDTGLGEYRSGEGVFGLRRAFAIAGADCVVMSLWQVPSEQTIALMEALYDRLLAEDVTAADALRHAKATVRTRWSETFFWGAFVAFGGLTAQPTVERIAS